VRPIRRAAIAVTIAVTIMSTAAMSMARPHDPKFDEADLALEKAQILLGAAACGGDEKAMKECQKNLDKAIQDIVIARADVAAAAAASDGSTGLLR
jgi:hypothetical protein